MADSAPQQSGQLLEYDDEGHACCPSCGGVTFYLLLPPGVNYPINQCKTCGVNLQFSPVPSATFH